MTHFVKINEKKTLLRDISELSNPEKIEEAKKVLSFDDEEDFKLGKRLLEAAQEDSEAKIGLAIILRKKRKFSLPDNKKSKEYLIDAYFKQNNQKALIPLISYFGEKKEIQKRLDLSKAKDYLRENLNRFKEIITSDNNLKIKKKRPFLEDFIRKTNNLFIEKDVGNLKK